MSFEVQVPKDVHKEIRWQRRDAGRADLIWKVLGQPQGECLPFSRPPSPTAAVLLHILSKPDIPADLLRLRTCTCITGQQSEA